MLGGTRGGQLCGGFSATPALSSIVARSVFNYTRVPFSPYYSYYSVLVRVAKRFCCCSSGIPLKRAAFEKDNRFFVFFFSVFFDTLPDELRRRNRDFSTLKMK